jgi:nitrite reductase/ring-hydroxylating ferredoxin subunit
MSDWRTLRFAPAAGTRLCAADEVPEGQGKEVLFGEGKDAFRVVLFRLANHLLAFHNCCPHFSLPLNYEPDRFHVFDGELLMCAHHAAVFRLPDGLCVDGLCGNERLTAIAIEDRDGEITIA